MNARVALVLVVLLAVVGGGALIYNRQERTETADNTAALGKARRATDRCAEQHERTCHRGS